MSVPKCKLRLHYNTKTKYMYVRTYHKWLRPSAAGRGRLRAAAVSDVGRTAASPLTFGTLRARSVLRRLHLRAGPSSVRRAAAGSRRA